MGSKCHKAPNYVIFFPPSCYLQWTKGTKGAGVRLCLVHFSRCLDVSLIAVVVCCYKNLLEFQELMLSRVLFADSSGLGNVQIASNVRSWRLVVILSYPMKTGLYVLLTTMYMSFCHIYTQYTRKKSCASLGVVNIPDESSVPECFSLSLGISRSFEGI